MLSISQTISSELDQDKPCKNYPFGSFLSYKDCDDKFVQEQVSKHGLTPFWATNNFDNVSALR